MGSVYPRGRKLWIKFKGPDGTWTPVPTEFFVGQEDEARELLEEVEARIAAREELALGGGGPLTTERYVLSRWLTERRKQVADWKNDELWLRRYILPIIGDMPLDAVRVRHIKAIVKKAQDSGKAQRTVRNVYSVCCALFRDAVEEELIRSSPCALSQKTLGQVVDKDPEWRATAIFSREELVTLISDPAVPEDRRVVYALAGLGALRHGCIAGLRWRHYQPDHEPLGRLIVVKSYDGRTKTRTPRHMPVHPTLAAMLAEWKLVGWPQMMGRTPGADDLVVPLPSDDAQRRTNNPGSERMRSRQYSWDRLTQVDLRALGLRNRRFHDLRRTMISLAITDGARKDLLKLCTHGPPKKEGIDAYITIGWEPLCKEISMLKVERRFDREVVSVAVAGGGGAWPGEGGLSCDSPERFPRLGTVLGTVGIESERSQQVPWCRDRDSNPDGISPREF